MEGEIGHWPNSDAIYFEMLEKISTLTCSSFKYNFIFPYDRLSIQSIVKFMQ